jgi:16S rRNA (guanine1207-N2)-methyltransferase
MSEPLECGGRRFRLERWPRRRQDPLRAWDTADRYLLDTLAVGHQPPPDLGRVLVVEDNHGALGVPLAALVPASRPVTVWADSHLTDLAIARNLHAAGLPDRAVRFLPATDTPTGPVDTVITRFPRALAAWDDLLRRLRPQLCPDTRVLAGGMIRHTPRRAFTLLETILGPTRTSLGWKKARLAESRLDPDRSPPPPELDPDYRVPGTDLVVRTAAGVFGREHLDGGTRALLAHLPRGRTGRLADLGCGNGVLALALARANPGAEILAVDASHRAVACAAANATRAGLHAPRLQVAVADGLADVPADILTAVVCNPPFHQDRTVGDILAWRMFVQAHRALAPGGELRVVGNRHLDHGRRLMRIFGNAARLASTGKYEVLRAVRR